MSRELFKYILDVPEKDGFIINEQLIESGTSYPLHWHDLLEFEIILSGSARHIYNGNSYTIRPGCAYLMCSYDFHELTALTDVKLYSIHFVKSLLDPEIATFLNFSRFHCQLSEEDAARIAGRIRELPEETENSRPFRHLMIKYILSEIVILMIRKSTAAERQVTPLPIQQAITWVNDHFLEKITLEDLAKHLSLSVNYVGQLFKNQMNCSFHEYLNILRLKYACNLLATSDLPVKEVAYTAGYRSTEYFLYVFKKTMGMTPSQYRLSNGL